jgi:predicted ArsR family transcriptional regulator
MTATAIRKHLEVLEGAGLVASHEQAPFGPKSNGPRGRGRPAKVFAITHAGREYFERSYDDIAVDAAAYIKESLGEAGVKDFARKRINRIFAEIRGGQSTVTAEELTEGLSDLGFSASLRRAPVVDAVQLCQHNCPISHVASEYPQFCEAETEAISAALGVHVTRISTIASGSEICTTHIPVSTTTRRTS